MNRIITASAIIALAAFAAAPAFAATPAKPAMAKPAAATMAPAKPKAITFATIDANKDGKLSLAEIQKYWPAATQADFDKYDANKDGSFNKAELAAFVKGMKASSTMKPAATTTK